MGNTVEVHNLASDEVQTFVGITPKDAVIAAYAQSRGDRNTRNYAKYGNLPVVGKWSIACGDFAALLK